MAEQGWAVILGASSGFGEATGLELARSGYNIIGVHLDRKGTQAHVDEVIEGIRAAGRRALFFNVNAADPERREEVLSRASEEIGPAGAVSVLLHSLAFGNLRPYIAETPQDAITQAQMDMTLGVMAHSLVYWVQDLVHRGLMRKGGKVFAMTSAGGTRVLPNYGAVSAAKAALESHVRQLAMELAPRGIAVNAIRAGVTDTPALRKIPGHEIIAETALKRNPSRRLTTPQDVARAIAGLCAAGTEWITGNVIGVDGGEDIIG
ncbi:MAG: SDR family oxidoreductase [Bacillati bacterium ANGP1]|uniref:SDR family oxidoreductase n=1 Tax=Candidatus Segetimicrobium genomatis TaxID=2569760 RepID=A0A537JMB5_9BACT|nr:MAG: SDR family oxidoreductase [Terrabacteria group bacterium ANGP1]